jgi:uncharacterized NAD(P)/FAD-binding protein YdhS
VLFLKNILLGLSRDMRRGLLSPDAYRAGISAVADEAARISAEYEALMEDARGRLADV